MCVRVARACAKRGVRLRAQFLAHRQPALLLGLQLPAKPVGTLGEQLRLRLRLRHRLHLRRERRARL